MRTVFQFVTLLLFSISFLLYQNCGKSMHEDFKQHETVSSSEMDNPLVLQDRAEQNTGFRVASAATFSSGTQFYWSAVYADSTYCMQTISTDGLVATFVCAQAGNVIVQFTATEVGGKLHVFTMPLVVGANGSVPPPSPTPTPGAGPGPGSPPPPDGAALYTSNCASCHGPLATSSKRGRIRGQLDSAIMNQPAMFGLSGLTSAERDAIIQALQ